MSLKADMAFGWKPTAAHSAIPIIPLCFGLIQYNQDDLIKPERVLYLGNRYKNSLKLHESYANKTIDTGYVIAGNTENKDETFKLKTYQMKLPQFLGEEVRYEEAFQSFSQAMAHNEAEYNDMKQIVAENKPLLDVPYEGI